MKNQVLPVSCYTLSVSEEHGHDSVNCNTWMGDKSYLVTIDSEASVTVAMWDITGLWRET
jgi:hypothetical protein